MSKDVFLNKVRSKSAKVVVFGLGHIGLPKAVIIARAGFQVIGVDTNSKIVEDTSKGRISISEPRLNYLINQVVQKRLLKAALNGSAAVKDADIIIVCVPTPIKEDKTPNLAYIENVCKTIAHNLSEGKLIIIESTLPPQTTKTFIGPILEDDSGLRCGLDFWLAYCPERTASGKAIIEFVENDRIVGGYNAESGEIATEFFKTFVKGNIQITEAPTAEIAKLAENTFRDINIAFANELALVCEEMGVDVSEAIKLANTHPRVNIHMPGPGVGGPCLPKDPYLLLHSSKHPNNIIKTARQINDSMPHHVTELILKAFKNIGKQVTGSKISVLGTAYKGNVDDCRSTPSKPIILELLRRGAKVTVYDPFCKENFRAKRATSLQEAIEDADCLVIVTDHTPFKKLNLSEIKASMSDQPIIIDGRRIIDARKAEKLGFIYCGIGWSTKEVGSTIGARTNTHAESDANLEKGKC
jgi:UDP-N-acetyl-D-mannosaminuronic acid dehydrogenase